MNRIFTIFGLFLLFNSCQIESNQFELSNLTTTIQNAKEYETKSSQMWNHGKDKYDTSRDITFDAYILRFQTSILNKTGEKIDNASYSVKVKLEFKSKEMTLDFGKRSIFTGLQYVTWNEDELIETENGVIMNDNSDFNRTLFIHTPKKATLLLYINASNSVGLNVSESPIAEKNITAEWKKLENELKAR
ncbi:hypothetical protein [Gelidibacter sp. F63206]|uniref:hypothetical protein n=1 Tax=Gelidibacter sp. F63206 TaxID=2926425 RepID=UPI001FF39AFF|nr:hypothetical protein [Gelidibacter sp. F63206]MCK0115401.1 hypothetical protein [Gelidibacter sp. F63206]